MGTENIEEMVLTLYNQEKWTDIVELVCSTNEFEKCRLFWVLPTMNDLCWIKDIIDMHNVSGLTSIGCGCGLLEWLFQKYSGLEVVGIELDRSWWCSKYSPPTFLTNMLFVHESNTKSLRVPENHALLFCYFNNASAFCDYIKNYRGKLVFVVGPKEDQHRWTDPMPFDKKFNDYGWKLLSKKEIERSDDYITVYGR
ncbi:PREDICTED: uncharacterized protein LOC107188612 [Dufourea novaeangliae]|uniref:Uncharacterized protein n=1 Tax=Dufourea novaeangliae TaxID=178035 RepID=A0A154PFB7_DUFNO|nr:PREDICTED: uncharacterized protein LOC107188612 [Dufourea novaeangliae]KZC10502.1 hypothetical protein WN55_01939 [Dufourea novaeangliae]